MTWCYACQWLTNLTLAQHLNGCPPHLVGEEE